MTRRPGVSDLYPEIMMTGIETDNLLFLWPTVSKFLQPALDHGETLDDMLTKLYLKEAQLWVTFEHNEPIAAVVTEIHDLGEQGKLCNIWAVGGTGINRWIDFLDMIEDWARANGCRKVIVEKTRKGVQRLLKNYKVTHVTLGKEL
jgi:hypothetical protein